MKNQNVRKLVEYKQGVWLILTGNAIRMVTLRGDTILEISDGKHPDAPHFETLYKDADGQFWVGSNRVLWVLDTQTMQFRQPA